MGDTFIALEDLFRRLGVDYVTPPPNNSETLRLGVKYAPEMICLPFKLNLGNFIFTLQEGANVLIHAGGCGPCRFGMYGNTADLLLHKLGYKFEMRILEPPGSQGLKVFANFFKSFAPQKSYWQLWNIIKTSYKKKQALDFLEKESLFVRTFQVEKGATDKALKDAKKLIAEAKDLREIEKNLKEGKRLIQTVEQDKSQEILRVGLVGEFFLLLEPFINFDIEKWLGVRKVFVKRSVYPSDWIAPRKNNLVLEIPQEAIYRAASPFLSYSVGGEGRPTIGLSVLFAEEAFDGIIHLMPFTCMPETIAKQILPLVSKEYEIPVMTLVIDEQTGKAGLVTRLEAFLDLLWKRREKKGELK